MIKRYIRRLILEELLEFLVKTEPKINVVHNITKTNDTLTDRFRRFKNKIQFKIGKEKRDFQNFLRGFTDRDHLKKMEEDMTKKAIARGIRRGNYMYEKEVGTEKRKKATQKYGVTGRVSLKAV